jgi:hypothetical protein
MPRFAAIAVVAPGGVVNAATPPSGPLVTMVTAWRRRRWGTSVVIGAAAEARRIERAKKSGEAVTGRGVPVIEKSAEKGLIGGVF